MQGKEKERIYTHTQTHTHTHKRARAHADNTHHALNARLARRPVGAVLPSLRGGLRLTPWP